MSFGRWHLSSDGWKISLQADAHFASHYRRCNLRRLNGCLMDIGGHPCLHAERQVLGLCRQLDRLQNPAAGQPNPATMVCSTHPCKPAR